MASVKIKFKPSTTPGKEGTIYYQIIHERKSAQLLTDYHVFTSEWDEKHKAVITKANGARKSFILSVRERMRSDIERLMKIIRQLDNHAGV